MSISDVVGGNCTNTYKRRHQPNLSQNVDELKMKDDMCDSMMKLNACVKHKNKQFQVEVWAYSGEAMLW